MATTTWKEELQIIGENHYLNESQIATMKSFIESLLNIRIGKQIINFILSEVEKEVVKLPNSACRECWDEPRTKVVSAENISTIINNLRVK